MIAWSDKRIQGQEVGIDGALGDENIVCRELLAALFTAECSDMLSKLLRATDGTIGQLVAGIERRLDFVIGRQLGELVD